MKKETADLNFARKIELAEIVPWFDMWDSIPDSFAKQYRMEKYRFDSARMLLSPIIQFSHFNQVMGLGLNKPASEEEVDQLLSIYHSAQVRNIELHVIPHTQPDQLTSWLSKRGLRKVSCWDRIYRGNEPLTYTNYKLPNMAVEKVSEKTADEWATFLVNSYNLQVTKPMALGFAIRPRWHHYLLKEKGKIKAIRSQYVHDNGTAWWGVEAPVPGFMTQRFNLDHHLCGEMINDGLKLGVNLFIGEIESVSLAMDHDGYKNFEALGFKYLYTRSNYSF